MRASETRLTVAIVGCGTVGSATAKLIANQGNTLNVRSRCRIDLEYIVDIDFTAAREAGLDSRLFCDDYGRVLEDDSVDVVIELIGGLDTARRTIERALEAGKHVVTANKALMAHFGSELLALARARGVCINFEASCGGGIPIVRAITDGLIGNRLLALYGILNGTCNFILTAMSNDGKSYRDALREAQEAGFAEADPTLDVSGHDTAHKLAILAALAFGRQVDLQRIPTTGIDSLQEIDVAYGQELGYVVKLLAIAQLHEKAARNGLSLCVRPAFITKEHPLAWVSGPFNAVSVYGDATGHTMYYGRGAGGSPTASAIVADLNAISTGKAKIDFDNVLWPDEADAADQLPTEDIVSRYYLRVMAEDKPGVLARIAAALGQNQIGIRSVLQKESPPGSPPSQGVPVVITTYKAREGDMQTALEAIDALEVVRGESVCIEIADEHPEEL